MKKFLLLAAVSFFVIASKAQAPVATPADATAAQPDISKVVWFEYTDHDLGKIPYGKPVEFDLSMKNLSSDSLAIKNVQAGCGCTTPKWQRGPYAAGSAFKITIGFNGYTEGPFSKIVTIFFENGMSQVIRFHGETFKAPDNPAPANQGVQQLKSAGGQ